MIISKFRGTLGFLGGLFVTSAALAVYLWYGLMAYPVPWKVTDPSSSEFRMEDFRFEDYYHTSKNNVTNAARIWNNLLEQPYPTFSPESPSQPVTNGSTSDLPWDGSVTHYVGPNQSIVSNVILC